MSAARCFSHPTAVAVAKFAYQSGEYSAGYRWHLIAFLSVTGFIGLAGTPVGFCHYRYLLYDIKLATLLKQTIIFDDDLIIWLLILGVKLLYFSHWGKLLFRKNVEKKIAMK